MKVLTLHCPRCRQDMKYQTKSMILSGRRKRCVYCGASFKVSEQVVG